MQIAKSSRVGLTVIGLLLIPLVGAAPSLAAAPETPLTEAPTGVTATEATLHGQLNPEASSEHLNYQFQYRPGASCLGGFLIPETPGEAEGNHTTVAESASGLQPSTQYSYCLSAVNSEEASATGSSVAFTTLGAKPSVDAESESGITPFDAVLEAQINPENQATGVHFEYANNAGMVGATLLGEGSFPGVFEDLPTAVDIGGSLEPSTTYYYRVVATNGTGATNGPIQSFTTLGLEAPLIDEEKSSELKQTDARLSALINPNFQLTTFQFKVGTDTSYGLGTVPAAPGELTGFGDQEVAVDLAAEGVLLEPNTEYHYEALATNAGGTTEGLAVQGDQTFLTLPASPDATTGSASSVSATSATVSGTVNPSNSGHAAQDDTTYIFEFGHTASYGLQAPLTPGDAGEGASTVPESETLKGLDPGTIYHYRISASNNNTGTPQVVTGDDQTFTTAAAPPILSSATASGVSSSAATLSAMLDPQGLPTHYELLLGATQGALQPTASGNTNAPITISTTAQPLSPGTLYYYRFVAENANGSRQLEGTFATASGQNVSEPLIQPIAPALLATPLIAFPVEQSLKKPASQPLTNAQKLAKALKMCRHRAKHKRAKCERQARQRYHVAKGKKS